MSDVPVERRTYFPLGVPSVSERRVWRRWVCLDCHAHQDVPEDESA